MLTRDEILNAHDDHIETVQVPEWGGELQVKGMKGNARDAYELHVTGGSSKITKANVRALLASLVIIDDDGKLMFSKEDVSALGGKSAAALDRVYDVGARLSGISEKDIEQLEKNS